MCVLPGRSAAQSCTSARPPRRARPGVRVGPASSAPSHGFHCGWRLWLLPPSCEDQASPSSYHAGRKSPPGLFCASNSFMEVRFESYNPPLHGVFRRGVSMADVTLSSLVSPQSSPAPAPAPANTSLFSVSGPACLDMAWPWSPGGYDLLCLASVTHRHALQVHPGWEVSGLPSSLSLRDTPLRAGVDFTCPVCPWVLGVRVLPARGVGA